MDRKKRNGLQCPQSHDCKAPNSAGRSSLGGGGGAEPARISHQSLNRVTNWLPIHSDSMCVGSPCASCFTGFLSSLGGGTVANGIELTAAAAAAAAANASAGCCMALSLSNLSLSLFASALFGAFFLGSWAAGAGLILASLVSASSARNAASSISRERFRAAAASATRRSANSRAAAAARLTESCARRAATRRTRASRSSSVRRPPPPAGGAGVKEKGLFSAAAAQGGQTKDAGSPATHERCATERPQTEHGAVGPGGETAGSPAGAVAAASEVERRWRQAEQKAEGR
jgi:hypothetical protein